jgi:oxygen-independent coproporphyrinogen-3 oxidase
MGYTHQYTQLMIGLGVSSISDSWFAFAQNVKKVEDYYNLLEKDELPIFKGHHLTEEDLLIRKQILNLMCQGKTLWDSEFSKNELLIKGLERMKVLEEDGLVEIGKNTIQVTQLGKRFLRNICMALDARLWADQPESQLFSMA